MLCRKPGNKKDLRCFLKIDWILDELHSFSAQIENASSWTVVPSGDNEAPGWDVGRKKLSEVRLLVIWQKLLCKEAL